MEDHIEVEGKVIAVLAGTMFRVELDNKHIVLATISGKMRKRFVRLTPGDRVKMKMSPYDLNKARIVWRIGGVKGCAAFFEFAIVDHVGKLLIDLVRGSQENHAITSYSHFYAQFLFFQVYYFLQDPHS